MEVNMLRLVGETQNAPSDAALTVLEHWQHCSHSWSNTTAMTMKSVAFTANLLRHHPAVRLSAILYTRSFSVLNRPPPNYEGHVPLTTLERGALAFGSAVGSLINPRRGGTTFQFPQIPQLLADAVHRPHRSPRRSDRNPLLYLPPALCHALLPYRPTHPSRPTPHNLSNPQHALPAHPPH